MDQYEILSRVFIGWSLSDIRDLSRRDRLNWLERAKRK